MSKTSRLYLALPLVLMLGAPSALHAQARNPAIDALDAQIPGTIINDPTRLDWAVNGTGMKTKPFRDAAIPGGGAATRYSVSQALAKPWEAQASIPLTDALARGEEATVGFWARLASGGTIDGKGTIAVRFQLNENPWPGFADSTISVTPQWQWYEATGVATTDLPKGKGIVTLQLGGARQEIEIGQAIVVKGAGSIVAGAQSAAVELPPMLAGKGKLLNRPDRREWGYSGPGSSRSTQEDRTIFLGQSTRMTSPSVGANPWDISAQVPIEQGVAEGDQLLIAVAAKTVSAATTDGKASVGIRIQDNSPPTYDGFINAAFKAGPNWQLIQLKVTSPMAIAPGKAVLALHFAGAQQVVDIGPVYVLKTN